MKTYGGTESRSLRPRWIGSHGGLQRPEHVELITDVTDRLCTNLELRIANFMNTHCEATREDYENNWDLICARNNACLDAVGDVKLLIYNLISEKYELSAQLNDAKRRRVEVDDNNDSVKKESVDLACEEVD